MYFSKRGPTGAAEECYDEGLRAQWREWFVARGVWETSRSKPPTAPLNTFVAPSGPPPKKSSVPTPVTSPSVPAASAQKEEALPPTVPTPTEINKQIGSTPVTPQPAETVTPAKSNELPVVPVLPAPELQELASKLSSTPVTPAAAVVPEQVAARVPLETAANVPLPSPDGEPKDVPASQQKV